jgi:hypothetical protein
VYSSTMTATSDANGRPIISTPSPPTTTTARNAPTGYRRRSATGTAMATLNTKVTSCGTGRVVTTPKLSHASAKASRLSTTSGCPRSQP